MLNVKSWAKRLQLFLGEKRTWAKRGRAFLGEMSCVHIFDIALVRPSSFRYLFNWQLLSKLK